MSSSDAAGNSSRAVSSYSITTRFSFSEEEVSAAARQIGTEINLVAAEHELCRCAGACPDGNGGFVLEPGFLPEHRYAVDQLPEVPAERS